MVLEDKAVKMSPTHTHQVGRGGRTDNSLNDEAFHYSMMTSGFEVKSSMLYVAIRIIGMVTTVAIVIGDKLTHRIACMPFGTWTLPIQN